MPLFPLTYSHLIPSHHNPPQIPHPGCLGAAPTRSRAFHSTLKLCYLGSCFFSAILIIKPICSTGSCLEADSAAARRLFAP